MQETVKSAKQICTTVYLMLIQTLALHVSHLPTTDEQALTTNGTHLTPPHAATDLEGVKGAEPRTSTDISKKLLQSMKHLVGKYAST